jgi:hypothetical protein
LASFRNLRGLCVRPWNTDRVAGSVRPELVPNALWAELCDHILEIAGVDRPCLTAVTRGLADVGQPEMIFTLTGSAGVENFPPGILEYLEWVHGMAVDGHILGPGDMSGVQPPGPFGSLAPFLGVVFSAATADHQVAIPPGAIQGVLITQGEFEMAQLCSPWRVLARLGQEAHYFPWPFWSDPLRPATYLPGDGQRSLLGQSGTPQLRLGRLDASLDSRQLNVTLTATEASQLAENLSTFPHLALVPPPDPAAAATLVWSPGQTKPTAIRADPALASSASARFLMILPNHGRRDQIRFQEDGFSAIVSRKTTKELIQHLRRGEPITLTAANKPSIKFIPR